MIESIITIVIFFVLSYLLLSYFLKGNSTECTVPGLTPTTKEDGNFPDIGKAGSLHQFLTDLHKRFGDIASFWMGKRFVVSIASPELFKDHQHVFDRPPELFRLYEPMFGDDAIQYANGEDGKARRNAYDKSFSHTELSMYYPKIQKVTDSTISKWTSLPKGEHIAVGEEMFAFAINLALTCLLGNFFDCDKQVAEFKKNYDLVWSEMEKRQADPKLPDENSERAKTFKTANDSIHKLVEEAIDHRLSNDKSEEMLLVDRIMQHSEGAKFGRQDCVTYLIASFHTTGNLLTWAIYFLALNEDIQEKVHREVSQVLGEEDVNPFNITDLIYLRQVIDETMRHVAIGPWGARYQHIDSMLGGFFIPKETPVIHAFGVVLQNENTWENPSKFDPERFSKDHVKDHPSLAFSPFGFAGKRKCPGHNFAYIESYMFLANLIRKFKVNLVEGQDVKPTYGFVTHPSEEVWITLTKRD